MISVLLGSTMDLAGFRGQGPAVGLFAGQEIRLIRGRCLWTTPTNSSARSSR